MVLRCQSVSFSHLLPLFWSASDSGTSGPPLQLWRRCLVAGQVQLPQGHVLLQGLEGNAQRQPVGSYGVLGGVGCLGELKKNKANPSSKQKRKPNE